jgi:hypothetical protein
MKFLGLEASGDFGKFQGLFWSITAPFTGAIMAITLYYVIISQYEPRKVVRFVWRLLSEWRVGPLMDRASVHAQKRFLNGLPLYRIKLEPSGASVVGSNVPAPNVPAPSIAASNVAVPSNAQYLLPPDGKPNDCILSNPEANLSIVKNKINTQEVTFGPIDPTNLPLRSPGVFRFDKTTGYLFLNSIDKHDYMYYAHIKPTFPPERTIDRSVVWKKIQMPFEREPLFFRGKFKRIGHELWGVLSRGARSTLWYKEFEYEGHRSPPTGFKGIFKRKVKPNTLGVGLAAVGMPQSQTKKIDKSNDFFAYEKVDNDRWQLGIRGLHAQRNQATYYRLILEPAALEDDYDGL